MWSKSDQGERRSSEGLTVFYLSKMITFTIKTKEMQICGAFSSSTYAPLALYPSSNFVGTLHVSSLSHQDYAPTGVAHACGKLRVRCPWNPWGIFHQTWGFDCWNHGIWCFFFFFFRSSWINNTGKVIMQEFQEGMVKHGDLAWCNCSWKMGIQEEDWVSLGQRVFFGAILMGEWHSEEPTQLKNSRVSMISRDPWEAKSNL